MVTRIHPSGRIMNVQETLNLQRAIVENCESCPPPHIARTAFVEIVAHENVLKVFCCDQLGGSTSFVEFSFVKGQFLVTLKDMDSKREPERFEPITFGRVTV